MYLTCSKNILIPITYFFIDVLNWSNGQLLVSGIDLQVIESTASPRHARPHVVVPATCAFTQRRGSNRDASTYIFAFACLLLFLTVGYLDSSVTNQTKYSA